MRKLAVRLLILSMFTAALLVGPVVTQVNAATDSSKEMKHKKRVVHRRPAVAPTRAARDPNANPFASKYEDDFDRKNAGGGGGY
jgi:hypothetical protein